MQRRPRKKPTITATRQPINNPYEKFENTTSAAASEATSFYSNPLESRNQHKNQSNVTKNAPGRKLTAAVLLFLSGNRASRPRLLLGRHGRRRRPRGANLPSNPSLAVPRARRARGMAAEKEAGGGGSFVGVGFRGVSPTVGILLMETGAGMALGSMIDGQDCLL